MKKIIETERLYLRELIMDDIQKLSKVFSDLESMQHYNEPFNQSGESGKVDCIDVMIHGSL